MTKSPGKGRIKAGESALIGNAGEHYVMAKLLYAGVVAGLTPRNATGFDILAAKGNRSVKIRVKTKSSIYDVWRWNARKDGSIFHSLSEEGDFTVLVDINADHRQVRFYILPTPLLDNLLKEDFEKWLATPGMRGKAHDPDNIVRNLHYSKHVQIFQAYQDHWELLWGGK